MNSRLGVFLTTVLMLGGIALWSVTVLADEQVEANSTVRAEARESAHNAHHEAAADAAKRIKASSKLDLDIELVGRTSTQVAGD
jgi:TRAP-type C4-dicarboxylate transport system substrate-binding protein